MALVNPTREVTFKVYTGNVQPFKVYISIYSTRNKSSEPFKKINCTQLQSNHGRIWQGKIRSLPRQDMYYKYSFETVTESVVFSENEAFAIPPANPIRETEFRALSPSACTYRDILKCPTNENDLRPLSSDEVAEGIQFHLEDLFETETETELSVKVNELQQMLDADVNLLNILSSKCVKQWMQNRLGVYGRGSDRQLLNKMSILAVLYGTSSTADDGMLPVKEPFISDNVFRLLCDIEIEQLNPWAINAIKRTCHHILQTRSQYNWLYIAAYFSHVFKLNDILELSKVVITDRVPASTIIETIIPKIKDFYCNKPKEMETLLAIIPEMGYLSIEDRAELRDRVNRISLPNHDSSVCDLDHGSQGSDSGSLPSPRPSPSTMSSREKDGLPTETPSLVFEPPLSLRYGASPEFTHAADSTKGRISFRVLVRCQDVRSVTLLVTLTGKDGIPRELPMEKTILGQSLFKGLWVFAQKDAEFSLNCEFSYYYAITTHTNSFLSSAEIEIKESNPKFVQPPITRYDIFQNPHEQEKQGQQNEKGRLLYVDMMLPFVGDKNLKDVLMEVEAIGFPKVLGTDKTGSKMTKTFLGWIHKRLSLSKTLSSSQIAYMALVLGNWLCSKCEHNENSELDISDLKLLIAGITVTSPNMIPSNMKVALKAVGPWLVRQIKGNQIDLWCCLLSHLSWTDIVTIQRPVKRPDFSISSQWKRICYEVTIPLSKMERLDDCYSVLQNVVSQFTNDEQVRQFLEFITGDKIFHFIASNDDIISTVAKKMDEIISTFASNPNRLLTVWTWVKTTGLEKIKEKVRECVFSYLRREKWSSRNIREIQTFILDIDLYETSDELIDVMHNMMKRGNNFHAVELIIQVFRSKSFTEMLKDHRKLPHIIDTALDFTISFFDKHKEQAIRKVYEILTAVKECPHIRSKDEVENKVYDRMKDKPLEVLFQSAFPTTVTIQQVETLNAITRHILRKLKNREEDIKQHSQLLSTYQKSGHLHVDTEHMCTVLRAMIDLRESVTKVDIPTKGHSSKTFESCVLNIIDDWQFWVMIFGVSGYFKCEIRRHVFVDLVLKQLVLLKEHVAEKTITVKFLNELQHREMSVFELIKAVLPEDLHKWKHDLEQLHVCKRKLKERLRHLGLLVHRVTEILTTVVTVSDVSVYKEELKARHKDITIKTLKDTESKEYWGRLYPLLLEVEKISIPANSKAFINVCRSLFEGSCPFVDSSPTISTRKVIPKLMSSFATDDYQIRTAGGTMKIILKQHSLDLLNFCRLLRSVCIPIFREHCFILSQSGLMVDMDIVENLMQGIQTDEFDDQTNIIKNFTDRKFPQEVLRALLHFVEFDHLKQKTQLLQAFLRVFGVEEACGIYDAIHTFHMLYKDQTTLKTFYYAAHIIAEIDQQFCQEEWLVIEQFAKGGELIHFLREVADEDLRNLIDAVEERSERYVSETTVSDFIDVKTYAKPLLKTTPPNHADVLVQALIRNRQITERANYDVKINVCINNIHSIMDLYKNVANRGEMTKEIIYNSLQFGIYVFMQDVKTGQLHVKLSYSREKTQVNYELKELNDLRSRALLLVNSRKVDSYHSNHNYTLSAENLHEFIEIIGAINDIVHLYYSLSSSGYLDIVDLLHRSSRVFKFSSSQQRKRNDKIWLRPYGDYCCFLSLNQKNHDVLFDEGGNNSSYHNIDMYQGGFIWPFQLMVNMTYHGDVCCPLQTIINVANNNVLSHCNPWHRPALTAIILDQVDPFLGAKESHLRRLRSFKDNIYFYYNNWQAILEESRNRYYFLNFFHSHQLRLLDDFFNRKCDASQDLRLSFQYVHPEVTMDELLDNYEVPEDAHRLDQRLHQLGKALQTTFETRCAVIRTVRDNKDHHFLEPTIDSYVPAGSLYIAELSSDNTKSIQVLLNLFKTAEGITIPEPNQVVFCHQETDWEEVDLLLNRCAGAFNSPFRGKLFAIVNVEQLQTGVQYQLVDKIKGIQGSGNDKFRLAIICREGQLVTDKFLPNCIRRISGISDSEMMYFMQKNSPNVEVVTSAQPGLGKTEYVKTEAFRANCGVQTIHVSGPVSKRNIVDQIKTVGQTKNRVLHIDCAQMEDTEMFDSFMFEVIVIGMAVSGSLMCSFPTSQVILEIANTQQDKLRNALTICSFFKRKHIQFSGFGSFIVSEEINSPVQVVCHYLKAMDDLKLDTTDIVLTGHRKLGPLGRSECQAILKQHFESEEGLTFTVIHMFLGIFAQALRRMSASVYFTTQNLANMAGKESKNIRRNIVHELFEISKQFSARSLKHEAFSNSEAVMDALSDWRSSPDVSAAHMVARVQEMVRWDESNHMLLVFHYRDSQTVSLVYRDLDNVPSNVKKLFETQLLPSLPLLDYRSMTQDDLHNELEKICRISPLPFAKEDLGELLHNYTLTPDNFLKMVLIHMRIKSRIPVIVMGETGCGKTTLITYLARVCEVKFHVLNLHAGVTRNIITEFVFKLKREAESHPKTEFWGFLDEINTCDHLGLLNDIICHRRCMSDDLPLNLVFMAACNPYRLRKGRHVSEGVQGLDRPDEQSKLVYRVYPLPETMMEYVWDYGSLDEDDEKAYIKRMLTNMRNDTFTELVIMSQNFIREAKDKLYCVSEQDINSCRCLPQHQKTILCRAAEKQMPGKDTKCAVYGVCLRIINRSSDLTKKQKEILGKTAVAKAPGEEIEDNAYCVSLRDVNRCAYLLRNIEDMLTKTGVVNLKDTVEWSHENRLDIRTMVLALCHCYYVRLQNAEHRKDYRSRIAEILSKKNALQFTEAHIDEMINLEQRKILDRMEVPKEIAKNQALRENVFILLVSILTRIPVFVIGKPGSSKSLSMQLIRSNLRGPDSNDNYFKTLPPVYVVSHQGSESSTADGIVKVFKKAENYVEHNEHVLPVVLLDEIGLAEKSSSNPLKVLHSLLEPKPGSYPRVAVVGISNWALDSAKMNRAIHLSRTPPTFEDLSSTAKLIRDEIAKTKGLSTKHVYLSDQQLNKIAKAYKEYETTQKPSNFHGLRDYYSLVKYLARETIANSNFRMNVERGILRNFGGLKTDKMDAIMNKFAEHLEFEQQPDSRPNVVNLIRENVQDTESRHLLLISSGDSATDILERILDGHEVVTIFGSKLRNDRRDKSEEYNYRIVSEIILHMERGVILILKDLESIYGSLYDMLNQNYTYVGKKRNCRVALGPNSNPICQVHDKFRCIVIVDENEIKCQDPPFLNRFEKQYLRYSNLLKDPERETMNALHKWLDALSPAPGLEFNPQEMFLGFHRDTLHSLVYLCTRMQTSDVGVMKACKDYLMRVASPDAVLRLCHSQAAKKNKSEIEDLQDIYFSLPVHGGLQHFLQCILKYKRNKSDCSRIVAYTHSHTNISLPLANGRLVQLEKLTNFTSERDLSNQVRHFWFESEKAILILQCTMRDAQNVMLAKCLIDRNQSKYMSSKEHERVKHVCIIVHIDRSCKADYQGPSFNFLCGWDQFAIESLEIAFPQVPELLKRKVSDLLDSKIINVNSIIIEQLLWCFNCIKYTYQVRPVDDASGKQSLLELIHGITKSPDLVKCFTVEIQKYIQNQEACHTTPTSSTTVGCESWQAKLACDKGLLRECSTLNEAMLEYIKHCVRVPLAKIIMFLEKSCGWAGSFKTHSNDSQEFWRACFHSKTVFNILSTDLMEPRGGESCHLDVQLLSFNFPFFKVFYDKLEAKLEWLQHTPRIQDQAERLCPVENELITELTSLVNNMHEINYQDYLNSHKTEYQDDICNIFSVDYMPDLNAVDRCKILSLLLEQLEIDTRQDGSEFVARLHVKIQNNRQLLTAELKLISLYVTLPENDIDTLFNNAKDKITEDVAFSTCLVSEICRSILPSTKVVASIGGLKTWHQKACLVVIHAGRVSNQSPWLHFLRFCRDFALFTLDIGIAKEYISHIAELAVGKSDSQGRDWTHKLLEIDYSHECLSLEMARVSCGTCDPLDSKVVFDLILTCLKRKGEENPVHVPAIDAFLCKYFNICLEANLDTPLLLDIIDRLQVLPTNARINGPRSVLLRVLKDDMEGEGSEKSVGEAIICENELDAAEYPNLQRVDEKLRMLNVEDPLVVLCCDLMEDLSDVAFIDTTVESVEEITTEEHRLLIIASASVQIFQKEECSLQFVTAVAFLNVFMKSASDLIHKAKDYKSFKRGGKYFALANTLNQILESSKILLLRFLKCMRPCKTMYDIKQLCEHISEPITALGDVQWSENLHTSCLGFNPLSYVDHYPEVFDAVVDWKIRHVTEKMHGILTKASESTKYRLALLAVLAEHFYFVQTSALKDSERQEAIWLIEQIQNFDDGFKTLVSYLLAIHEFPKVLRVSETTSNTQLQLMSVIIHLLCIVFSQSRTEAMTQIVTYSLMCTNIDRASNVPALGYQSLISPPVRTVYTCECKCGVTIPRCKQPYDELRCGICNGNMKFEKHNLAITPDIEKSKEKTENLHVMPPIAYRSLDFITCSCFLTGISFDLTTEEQVKSILAEVNPPMFKSDGATVEMPSSPCYDEHCMDIKEYLTNRLQMDWNLLCDMTSSSSEDVMLFLHNTLRLNQSLLTEEMLPQNNDDRNQFEMSFTDTVQNQVRFMPTCQMFYKNSCLQAQRVTNDFVEMNLDELDEIDVDVKLAGKTRLFRNKKKPSFEDFRSRFTASVDEKEEEYVFLNLCLSNLETLQLIRHLPVLVQWKLLISNSLNGMIKRKDAKYSTIGNFLDNDKLHRDQAQHDYVQERFCIFEASFKEVNKMWYLLPDTDKPFRELNLYSPVSECLNNEGVLNDMINRLLRVQNDFLVSTLAIASKGGCSSLDFLGSESGGAYLRRAPLHKADNAIIHYEWSDDILDYCDINTEYGLGCVISYDFSIIEQYFARMLVVDKCLLVIDNSFADFAYSDELFHSCSAILSEIHHIIPQERLSSDIVDVVRKERDRRLTFAKDLLQYLEVILVLVKKTAGEGESFLDDYIKRWLKKLPGSFPEQLLPESLRRFIKLQHLVHLYETLEDLIGDEQIDSLDGFKTAITEDVVDALANNLKVHKIEYTERVNTVIRRFVLRYVRNKSVLDPDTMTTNLADLMKQSAGRTLDYDVVVNIHKILPREVKLKHVVTVLKVISKQILQRKDHNRKKKNVKMKTIPLKREAVASSVKRRRQARSNAATQGL